MSNKQHNTGKQNVGTTKELPSVISFCTGYAGIERGLDLAGIKHRVIAYVEIEAYAIANLVEKMETGKLAPAPIWTDLKTFPSEMFSGKVDLITGGYPCQPFSQAGKRKGAEDERHLWPYIREHIKAIKPNRCFFENVEGHISLGLSTVISDLEEDGYRTAWGIFSAREVGAPHQRKRVYIMGNTQKLYINGSKTDGKTSTTQAPKLRNTGCQRSVGNTKHYGSSTPEKRRSVEATSSDNKKGQVKTIESTRTSEPGSCGDIQTSKLANTNSQRHQRSPGSRSTKEKGQPIGQLAKHNEELIPGFPSRPEQQQYGWERPRTKPRLGRTVDGYSNRADRLRLLGNGVVPQTAAKAWLTLTEQV
ncbi:DNA (cytosine-5-)-methyltransferase [bacterium]|nr:DNA (cytosine-5-)-methyltransferase [bacterium]